MRRHLEVGAMLLALAGCRRGVEQACNSDDDCREELTCFAEQWKSTGETANWDTGIKRCTVRASADKICSEHTACKAQGRCSVVNGQCAVKSDDDCKKSEPCERQGQCTAKDGGCIAGRNEDCAKLPACTQAGRCTAKDGQCMLASDADCEHTFECQEQGQCTFEKDKCVIGKDADCKRGADSPCDSLGACVAKNGACVATAEGCKASSLCKRLGSCSFDPEKSQCTAGSDDDCKNAEVCRDSKQCQAEKISGMCVEFDCGRTTGCKQRGECTRMGDVCAVGSEGECRESDACKKDGKCGVRLQDSGELVCVKP